MLDWPHYTLSDGWLIDEQGNACPEQDEALYMFTPTEAEKWLANNDIRGSVLGSSFKSPKSRDYKG